jgi:uncharacterized integral membrane protein
MSFFLSSTLAVLLFAGMQMYKHQLASHEWMTIFGGFLGSILFCLILTAVSNFESTMFGKNFQTQLFPEVILCLFAAMFASGLVHRVCVTTCFLFSMMDLYYINKLSQSTYAPITVAALSAKTAKKKN